MSNPSPILFVSGRVHAVTSRDIPSAPERPEQRDENGAFVSAAMPAREGYTVQDVTVLTEHGGFATVSLLPAALEALGGELPAPQADVSYPVRPYVSWQRNGSRSFSRVGLSVAGEVAAAIAKTAENAGRRSVQSVAG